MDLEVDLLLMVCFAVLSLWIKSTSMCTMCSVRENESDVGSRMYTSCSLWCSIVMA